MYGKRIIPPSSSSASSEEHLNVRTTPEEVHADELGEEEAEFEVVVADAADNEEDQIDLLDEGQEESDAAVIVEINNTIEENRANMNDLDTVKFISQQLTSDLDALW